jgi:hypothetical protein
MVGIVIGLKCRMIPLRVDIIGQTPPISVMPCLSYMNSDNS